MAFFFLRRVCVSIPPLVVRGGLDASGGVISIAKTINRRCANQSKPTLQIVIAFPTRKILGGVKIAS